MLKEIHIIILIAVWTIVAFGEEFLNTGYYFKWLAKFFGNTKKAWLFAGIITSIYFGVAHYYQGVSGMITISIITLFTAFIFYKNKDNLWVLILIHGLHDTWGLTFLYLGMPSPIKQLFEQLLLNEKDGLKLKIQKMKLLNVSIDSIEVKLFGHYYEGEREIFSKYKTEIKKISRKDINQILVNAKPPIRKGLSIYRIYEHSPDFTKEDKPTCYYCLDITDENLFDDTLISDQQIKSFDYENQKIELTESGKRQIEKLEIPLQGMPVVLTFNGEIIYGFWLWNEISSFGCDRVYSYPKTDFKINFGLPQNNTFGNDPRFDERLKNIAN